jgi:hypothetical protein
MIPQKKLAEITIFRMQLSEIALMPGNRKNLPLILNFDGKR